MATELDDFQKFVDTILIRNKSILDQTTKLQDACTHLSRTISKSATTCGCIRIDASKQPYDLCNDTSIEALHDLMNTHVNGTLCDNCIEKFEKEAGRVLFYLAAIANTFEISLSDILALEVVRTNLLGKYSLR